MKLLCNVLLLCALAMAIPIDSLDLLLELDQRASLGFLTSDVTINGNLLYLMEVKVGSQGQVFHPIADSGSLVLWLPNDDDWVHHSTSLVNTTEPFSIQYVGSNPATGYYVNDTVALAGGKIDKFELGVIEHGAATNQGIVGLSRPMGKYVPFPIALKNAGTVDHGVASIYYSTTKNKGTLVFGGYDKAKVASPWSSHSDPLTFKVPITNVTTKGKTYYPDHGNFPIVIDTGSGYSWLPKAILSPIASLYKNAHKDESATSPARKAKYQVDCDIPDGLFQLGFGDLILDIPLKDFVNQDGKTCYLGAGEAELFNNVTLIGAAVLKQVVTLFDYDKGVVKVAHFKDTDVETLVKPE